MRLMNLILRLCPAASDRQKYFLKRFCQGMGGKSKSQLAFFFFLFLRAPDFNGEFITEFLF